MDDGDLMQVLSDVVVAVRGALDGLDDWRGSGIRSGQYHLDLVADAAAVPVLVDAGLGVLSEESGLQYAERPIVVALDPVDGSTNASRGLPWYATSLCAMDGDGLRAALVVNQASGDRFEAVRGGGARRNGVPIRSSGCQDLGRAMVCLCGSFPGRLGWAQTREMGAAALDLCAVAAGVVDAYLPSIRDIHGPWDYLGAVLVCQEAGTPVVDAGGRDLVTRVWEDRRTPVAAASPELLRELLAAQPA